MVYLGHIAWLRLTVTDALFFVFIKNVVAVAAYSRLASQSQANFTQWNWDPFTVHAQSHLRRAPHTPIVRFDFRLARERTWVQFTHCTSGLPRRLSNTKTVDSCGFLWSLSAALRLKFWASRLHVKPFVYVLSTVPVWTKWRSHHVTGRLQLNLSPSFPGVRISEGVTTTIFAVNNAAWMKGNRFVLKTIPVSFARIGCLRCKAAAAAKKASKRDAMDDSVEIHAPDKYASIPLQAFQQRRVVQSQTNQDKSHEFLGPRNQGPWFLRWNGPALTGRTAVASRSADRKRRQGADNRQDSPRHQSSRRWEDERSRPSYLGGSSSRKRAKAGSVSKACRVGPFGLFLSTSSSSVIGRSSIPVISFISGISRPQVTVQSSWEKTRERR